jgi:hypothetical protein
MVLLVGSGKRREGLKGPAFYAKKTDYAGLRAATSAPKF